MCISNERCFKIREERKVESEIHSTIWDTWYSWSYRISFRVILHTLNITYVYVMEIHTIPLTCAGIIKRSIGHEPNLWRGDNGYNRPTSKKATLKEMETAKVVWKNHSSEEATWGDEEVMWAKYPQLFTFLGWYMLKNLETEFS